MEMVFRDDVKSEDCRVRVGSYFCSGSRSEVYILAEVFNSEVALICLNDGLRWDDAVCVEDQDFLTRSEFERVSNGLDLEMIPATQVRNYF